ncbi:MAG: hypothetical protein OSB69_21770 [Alphaproteobacteria bacterium]|nr:hypothetical protein [Alphaproteobacteria bacterium]
MALATGGWCPLDRGPDLRDHVSLECASSNVPISVLGLLPDKEILVGAIDVATTTVETPEQVADTLAGLPSSSTPSASSPAPIAAWPPCRAMYPRPNCGR